jgi:hypothetical protein
LCVLWMTVSIGCERLTIQIQTSDPSLRLWNHLMRLSFMQFSLHGHPFECISKLTMRRDKPLRLEFHFFDDDGVADLEAVCLSVGERDET